MSCVRSVKVVVMVVVLIGVIYLVQQNVRRCMYVCVCRCMYVYVQRCMYVCVQVYVCVCAGVYVEMS